MEKCLKCGAACDGSFEVNWVLDRSWFLLRRRIPIGHLCKKCIADIGGEAFKEVVEHEEDMQAIR